jgi:arginyl-tRNA--protein-N-Asp/Glu arginylyltransferase
LSLRINPEPDRHLQVSAFRGPLSRTPEPVPNRASRRGKRRCPGCAARGRPLGGCIARLTSKIAPAKRRVSASQERCLSSFADSQDSRRKS